MTTRDYLITELVLVVLVGALIWANISFVQPAVTPVLPKIKIAPEEQVTGPAYNKNIVATTLNKIKSMFKKEDRKGFEPRYVGRNPFLWPEEKSFVSDGKKLQTSEQAQMEGGEAAGLPKLKMVIVGENRKIALINTQLVFEGSKIGGDTVKKIEEQEVLLTGEKGETRLSLAEYKFTPAQEKEPLPPPEAPSVQTPVQEKAIEDLFEKLKPFLEKGQKTEPDRVK